MLAARTFVELEETEDLVHFLSLLGDVRDALLPTDHFRSPIVGDVIEGGGHFLSFEGDAIEVLDHFRSDEGGKIEVVVVTELEDPPTDPFSCSSRCLAFHQDEVDVNNIRAPFNGF